MENRKTQLFTIIICVSLIFTVTFLKKNESSKKNKQTSLSELTTETEINCSIDKNKGNSNDKQVENEEKLKEDNQYFTTQQMKDNAEYYIDDATDGSTQGIYFSNGDVLYDNPDIPTGVYYNQLEKIESYIELNIPEKVNEMEIMEDSVKIENNVLSYELDLKNQYIMYVKCDLETYKFRFSDTKKYD